MTADPREDRLPKWAQTALASERSKSAALEREIGKMRETVEWSRISYGDLYGFPQYIPDERYGPQRVRFTVEGEQSSKYHETGDIEVSMPEAGVLELRGSRSLVLRPHVSNVLRVSLRKWSEW
ncbi:hypothetical protein CH253_08315 [Rhodococcus sp. 06-156-3C]|uniref:DUF7239 family protein n=1 Tax=Rhodococcus sp. 06-156-3C TaxID=2022486 RepID=UPI000B9C0783|nr:hypothetical protein [Rhodococcus sp. 06-156-3C]OZD23850.1 hypothetical protein CH253_08315 [Rhodococcus sp. 06-156-3C]